MSLPALLTLRDFMSANTAINAWWMANYANPVKHFIGYKKPVNANDYPAICYIPVRDKRGQQPWEPNIVSMVVSLCEKEMTNNVFDGVAKSDAIVQLMINALQDFACPISIEGGLITVTTDLGQFHPFYDTEMQMTLMVEPVIDTTQPFNGSTIGDFNTMQSSFDIGDEFSAAVHEQWAQETPIYIAGSPELIDLNTLP
jgi:hypothetical protein